ESCAEKSEMIKKRVEAARNIQLERFKHDGIFSNSQMNHRLTRKYCRLNEPSQALIKQAIIEMGFSARCYDKILKLSMTIADLDTKDTIESTHVSEAIQLRSLDRSHWI
ncbi:MAG: magnesium chelatase, partial [Candidatus Omnitrophica bacterium]|nr:magnesium chelatase [Candidatus Omnitrophota bacterium]